MTTKKKGMEMFDEIINHAKGFVEEQKGKWDHTRWENFLSEIRERGVHLTEDLANTIGVTVESLKNLYSMNPMDIKIFNEVITYAKNFVDKQKGAWDHSRWEGFLEDIQQKGVSITEDTKRVVGATLESLKQLYISAPKKIETYKAIIEDKDEAQPQTAPTPEPTQVETPEAPIQDVKESKPKKPEKKTVKAKETVQEKTNKKAETNLSPAQKAKDDKKDVSSATQDESVDKGDKTRRLVLTKKRNRAQMIKKSPLKKQKRVCRKTLAAK